VPGVDLVESTQGREGSDLREDLHEVAVRGTRQTEGDFAIFVTTEGTVLAGRLLGGNVLDLGLSETDGEDGGGN